MRTYSKRALSVAAPTILIAIAVSMTFSPRTSRVTAGVDEALSSEALKPVVRFTNDGQLIQPRDYRKWIYVGTPLTPNDMNDGKAGFPEFHSVYIDRRAFQQYERSGEFPDGTVLVKELVSVGSKSASSGEGYFMGEFTGLEVLVKDTTRFRDEPGSWGFFSFGHEYPLKATAKMQPTENCSDCHGGAADDDHVFTQYYPVLRAAKGGR